MPGLVLLLAGCQTPAGRRAVAHVPSSAAASADVETAQRPAREVSASKPLRDFPETPAETGRPSIDLTSAVETSEPVATVSLPANASDERSAPAADENVPLRLTLREAVATGLYQNPDLIALRTQEGVSLAALGVAQTYPWNPNFQAQYLARGNPSDKGFGPGTSSGQPNYQLILMHQFELAHQQRDREGNAAALLNQTRWTIQQAELTNVATTTQFYFTALYQKLVRDLSRETAALNDKLLGVVQRRQKGGLATVADVTAAKVAARQSRRQAKLDEANFQTALLALRRQLNLPIDTTLDLTDSLAAFEWLPVGDSQKAADLAARLAEGRPDVLAASAGVTAAHANVHLARASKIPNLQAGPMYQTGDNGVRFAGVAFQIDIPVLNTGEPLARQRRAELYQQAVTYEQLKQRATREAATAIDRYERARRLAAESRVDLTPFSKKSPPELTTVRKQFLAGQATILTVFATETSLIQERQAYLALLNELAQSAAAVVLATGLPPQRLVRAAAPNTN